MSKEEAEPDDAGFTLVELLVAVVIEAMIVGALGMAFIGILQGTSSVNQSLSRSGDARITAAYLISDARNSSGPEVSLTTSTCADASPPVAGGTLVVQFGYTTTASLSGTTTSDVVDYVLGSNRLMRRECKNGALVSDRIVSSSVASVTAACLPTADCSGSPTSVTMTITETATTSGAPYVYKLTATFRKLLDAGDPVYPKGVMTLGSGTNCTNGGTGISLTASASLVIRGAVYVNSINNACKALSMTSNSSYQAGSTYILSGGTCASTTGATPCPTYTSYSPALSDPYASLPTPTGGTAENGTCPGGVAQPGVYASTFTISGTTCQLASGAYIFQNGVLVTSSGSLTSAAGGVLLYNAGGQMKTQSSGSINVSAQTTGSYNGVAMWQPATNTNDVAFTSGSVTLNGALYAPKANANFGANSTVANITQIVSQTIWMANADLTIGAQSATPLSIGNASLPAWTVGQTYPSTTLVPTGGDGLYNWTVSGLPAGLSFDSTAGVISGTPTASGSSSVTVTLGDPLGDDVDTNVYTLVINDAPSITSASPLPGGDLTVAYNRTLTKTGGTGTLTWSAPNLPAGLSFNTSTGAITGTPTATGTTSVAVTLTDSTGASDSANLSLTVSAAPSITTTSFSNGVNGVAYSTTLAKSGGTAGYTWGASPLPAGLSIAPSTGVISGTPTASGSTSVVITLTDGAGGTATKTLSLVVQPKIVSVAMSSGTTAGKMEAGDKITIVYSDTMKVSSFCSSWTSGDAANQSLTGNNLQVNVANGTTDSITITNTSGTGCTTFNLGTINMASNAYVTAATVFGGSGGNTSIAWTASTKTLVITLGALKSGTVGTVSTSTSPVYTASAAITDSGGRTLGNSPFTLSPAAVRF